MVTIVSWLLICHNSNWVEKTCHFIPLCSFIVFVCFTLDCRLFNYVPLFFFTTSTDCLGVKCFCYWLRHNKLAFRWQRRIVLCVSRFSLMDFSEQKYLWTFLFSGFCCRFLFLICDSWNFFNFSWNRGWSRKSIKRKVGKYLWKWVLADGHLHV